MQVLCKCGSKEFLFILRLACVCQHRARWVAVVRLRAKCRPTWWDASQTGVESPCRSICWTVCWPVFRHKLMIWIVMVRHMLLSLKYPLSVCPSDMQGTFGIIWTRNVSVTGVKSVKSCAPSSTPWSEIEAWKQTRSASYLEDECHTTSVLNALYWKYLLLSD